MPSIKDVAEFYCSNRLVGSVDTSTRLTTGDLISIRAVTYEVLSVTFALDHSDDWNERCMRQNVNVKELT